MLKGNRGEWSEIYALLKIVADKAVTAGDAQLNPIKDLVYPVISVLRDESDGVYTYKYEDANVIIETDGARYGIPIEKFRANALKLLKEIQNSKKTTFEVSDVAGFLESFGCTSIKASSTSKSDIRIVIHDVKTSSNQELGFSIKSQLGGASTLLNAGKTTNFIYAIEGNLIEEDAKRINSIDSRSKVMDRLLELKMLGCELRFKQTERAVFGNNLVLIDSRLPEILADIVLRFYSSKTSNLSDLLAETVQANPLGFNLDNNHPFYEYKVKRFLTDIALGMMPSKVWTGKLDATGGYLVVKEDGDILCYHIYNRNDFEDYLLANTKLETASTSRHGFGEIYWDNEARCKLNLQIRFIK
jgi:type II restriction enzyme